MKAMIKPVVFSVMVSVAGTGAMIQTAQAGVGKKLVGAAVVGGVAHHIHKKHKAKKQARKAAAQQAAQQKQQPTNNK